MSSLVPSMSCVMPYRRDCPTVRLSGLLYLYRCRVGVGVVVCLSLANMHPCKGFAVKIVKMVEESKGADENAVKVVEEAKMSRRVRTTCVLWGARDGVIAKRVVAKRVLFRW